MELDDLTTAHLADAALRLGRAPRAAPAGLVPLAPGMRVAGPVLPVRHRGSVDVFLEALDRATTGSVLVVDDGGRRDRACIGDLVVREAALAGVAGLVVHGLHRDTAELREIGLPVFSLGAYPVGPQGTEPREPDDLERAVVGGFVVGREDLVLADDDGVLFLGRATAPELVRTAREIAATERRQARLMAEGTALRDQLAFADYLRRHAERPGYGFREHLRAVGGAIES